VDELQRLRVSRAEYLPKFHRLFWDITERLQNMRRLRIDIQVLSLANPWTEPFVEEEVAKELCSKVNEEISELVQRHPDHFVGLGTIPLGNSKDTIRELQRIKKLGLKGVCTGTRFRDTSISNPRFLPILRGIQDLDLVLFIHPSAPHIDEHNPDGGLIPAVGFPSETSLGLVRLALAGVLRNLPRLKIVASHLGGTLPYLAERIDAFSRGFYYTGYRPVSSSAQNKPPSQYLKSIYVDSISYSTPALDLGTRFFGFKKVLFGTDYPLTLDNPARLLRSIEDLHLSRDRADAIFALNAINLLGLKTRL
jgi:aminocarboxymuconate-semialdehyde decarboxylase